MTLPLHLKPALLCLALGTVSAQAGAATYKLNVWAPGVRAPVAAGPVAPTPAGTATGLLAPVDSADFGTVLVGSTAQRNFRFTNTGNGIARDLRAVVSSGDLRISTSSCGVTESLVNVAPGASCDVSVAYSPAAAGPLAGTLAIGGAYSNSPSALALTGQGTAEAIGVLEPTTSSEFGTVPLGSSVSRTFSFKNTGNLPATSVAAQIPSATGLTLSGNTCGTTAAPVTVAAGAACSIGLSYGGSTAAKLSGARLRVAGNFTGAPAELALNGSIGNFDATGVWSTSYSSIVAPAGTINLGTRTTGSTTPVSRDLFLRNSGSNGGISASFRLHGDTQHFTIERIIRLNSSGSTEYGCQGGIAADKLSVAECTTQSNSEQIAIKIAYSPKSSGTHKVMLTPLSNNGTALPGALEIAGTSQYNPAAVWSVDVSKLTAPMSSTINFGSRSVNSTTTRSVFVRNSGNYGGMGLGFTLGGDVAAFKITRIVKLNGIGSVEGGACALGDGRTTPICPTEDPSQGTYVQLGFNVQYAPTAVGNHSVTITPNTNNGTVLPEPLVVMGAAL